MSLYTTSKIIINDIRRVVVLRVGGWGRVSLSGLVRVPTLTTFFEVRGAPDGTLRSAAGGSKRGNVLSTFYVFSHLRCVSLLLICIESSCLIHQQFPCKQVNRPNPGTDLSLEFGL